MWEQQLASMMEAGHLDENTRSDFSVTYAAETGDASLIESLPILFLAAVCSGWAWSGSSSYSRVGVCVTSWSWVPPSQTQARDTYWTGSGLRAASTSLSRFTCGASSRSACGTDATSRSLSWSKHRASCWSESRKRIM